MKVELIAKEDVQNYKFLTASKEELSLIHI